MTEPQPRRAAPYRMVAVLMLVAAIGAIALATLGAGADRGSLGSYEGPTRDPMPLTQSSQPEPELPDDQLPREVPEPARTRTAAPNGAVILVVLAAVAVSVLAIWLLLRLRALATPPPPEADPVEETEELTAEQAREALEDAREQLSTAVDAEGAVIAAWLALERAIAAVGIRRRPSQTTLEYVLEVLHGVQLDRAHLDRFAHLYRRALFDDAPLVEHDRDEARTLLDALTAQLEQRGAAR